MEHTNWIAILDFGSQYSQLIARRIREQNVYSELLPYNISIEKLKERKPAGIILSGSPSSVLAENALQCDPEIFNLGIPILGICYGMQLTALVLKGVVSPGKEREFGYAKIHILENKPLFEGIESSTTVWMSHGDQVEVMPKGFKALAKTSTCPIAAFGNDERKIYGLQFHPEVAHTPQGKIILRDFLFNICLCSPTWDMPHFIEQSIKEIREKVGKNHVICGLSGGVDSSVVAVLLHRAIGDQLHCIFVDNGLLRYDEAKQVEETFGKAFGLDLHVAHSADLFLNELKGVIDPEKKRKIIGKTFIDVFSEKARELPDIKFLAQGTLYPDVIESISPAGGPLVTIKSHHNVGGLPDDLQFSLIEPVRELFKDEVRILGRELGIPDELVSRQPFPGPGLAVRIIGEITHEAVALLQQADLRVQQEIEKLDCYKDIWQSFAILLPIQTVGVMGDSRTYENVVALRVVESLDGMTAKWYRVPYDTLGAISSRIINEVKGVNRVVYDISSKPPATIEWE